jgi:IS30 family transposase
MSKSTRNSGKAWTSQDRQQLRQLAAENTPTRVIGLKMGRTPDAIYSQAVKQGTSLEPHNQRPYGTKKR